MDGGLMGVGASGLLPWLGFVCATSWWYPVGSKQTGLAWVSLWGVRVPQIMETEVCLIYNPRISAAISELP